MQAPKFQMLSPQMPPLQSSAQDGRPLPSSGPPSRRHWVGPYVCLSVQKNAHSGRPNGISICLADLVTLL